MKRLVIVIFLLVGAFFSANADHVTGGEMYYTYNGFSNGLHHYSVTYKLFMRCFSNRNFANPTVISVFDKSNNSRVTDITVALSHQTNISLPDAGPCINNPPLVCYDVGYYFFTISLPESSAGYLLASQVNYRISGITNLQFTPGFVGATYSCEIPGNQPLNSGPANHSAVFTGSDLVVVCANNYFSYSFAAHDDDSDELFYSFCTAYNSSTTSSNGTSTGSPPFPILAYNAPAYNSSSPLGPDVQIDASTGLITGIAPSSGIYVVTVCVQEIRNGILMSTQRKDIQINIADCNMAAAILPEDYMLCDGVQTVTMNNLSQSPLITSHDWTVINPSNVPVFTTTGETLTYTFPSAGTYTVRLAVNRGQQCSDSVTTKVYYYPGFIPDFTFTGICINKPSIFSDHTTTITGEVDSWKWDFGDQSSTADISSSKDASYTYPSLGTRSVRLIVTNTDGCRDTVTKTISIIDKPPINFAFRDTLICLNDQVQLQATGMGNFSWSPNTSIINVNSPNPIVSPTSSTTYYADLDSDGCLNRDSVRVRVVDHVSLQVRSDTTICSGDSIHLSTISDGLRFSWTPANQLVNANEKDPIAITDATTNYIVTAQIGGCSATDGITVIAVPYPSADAGPDITICYNASTTLRGSTNGNSWQWSPAHRLTDPGLLNPIASPLVSTAYIFKSYESTRGCPKPGMDTILVTVLPRIQPSAGNDTAVIIGQQLQFEAHGGIRYEWSPANNLSAFNIANPVAVFTEPSMGNLYRVLVFNEAGCMDSAFIRVRVFATRPTVFVPTAFTPNNDGKNDLLAPIVVGMKQIEFFHVYNRWGQIVFSGKANGRGWDGRVNGQLQGSNTYVWIVKAIDFQGMPYFQKGHVTLIR
jgi:gliding motility-associated-like protein